jgi:hypothetical protein
MTTTTNSFVLKFNSNIGRVIQITIPRALTNKSPATTEASMQAIIANGAVSVANRGVPASIYAANVITTERRPAV